MIASVTGATGYVGQFVLRRLRAEGVQVRAWRRARSTIPRLSEDVDWIAGDLRDPLSMAALMDRSDVLVHCALDHVPGRYRGGEGADLAGFVDANVAGSIRLLRAAHAAGVRRCVVLSSRAVFGDKRSPGILADEAPLRPDTHYGAAKMALEAFVWSFAQSEGWAVAALRPTGVYGLIEPIERTKWFDVVSMFLDGHPLPSPRAGTEVHGEDVAAAVWQLLTADPQWIAGRAFNCSDIVIDTARICGLVRELAGIDTPLQPAASAPAIIMACPGLEALGLRFGGEQLLKRTIGDLVQAVQQQRHN